MQPVGDTLQLQRRMRGQLGCLVGVTLLALAVVQLAEWRCRQGAPLRNSSQPGLLQHSRSGTGCQRPALNESVLDSWGCKVFTQACFDQGSMILHSGLKTPGHANYTHRPLFEVAQTLPFHLPEGTDSLGQDKFGPKAWDIIIRGPSKLDQPDIQAPGEFTSCTVPLVWWPAYFSVFADFFLGSVMALDGMRAEGAFDRSILLAPVSLGLSLPGMYSALLEPYSRHPVVSLSELSSRERKLSGEPRCFERAVLCNLAAPYSRELRPKLASRRAVQYYREARPEAFQPHEQRALQEGGKTFRIAFFGSRAGGTRVIRNLDQAIQECRRWSPPADTPFRSVDCVVLPDATPERHVELLAQLQNVHALVNTHGSGNIYAYYLPSESALVEIIPWSFDTGCPFGFADYYFSKYVEADGSVNSGYFRLVADKEHTFPGPYEAKGVGRPELYARDQDVALNFSTLAKALEKVQSNESNREERKFYMTQREQ